MGLGKTVQAVAWFGAIKCAPRSVICPAIVRGFWAQEISDWLVSDIRNRVAVMDKIGQSPELGINVVSYQLTSACSGSPVLVPSWGKQCGQADF